MYIYMLRNDSFMLLCVLKVFRNVSSGLLIPSLSDSYIVYSIMNCVSVFRMYYIRAVFMGGGGGGGLQAPLL